jgi:competence protein ComEA
MSYKLLTINYKLVFLLIHTFSAFIYPLFEEKYIFAKTAGLCNTNAAADDNVVSVYYNPAGLFKIPKASFYFSNTKLYGIDELLSNTICFSAEVKHLGKIGLLYNNFGFDLYKENLIKFVYANSIKERISFGIGFNSLSVDIKNYRSKSFPSIDLGVLAEVDNKVLLGFYIKNFDLPKIADDEIVSQTIVVGSKITPVKDVSTYIDVVKNTEQDVFAKIAEEVSLNIIKNFITIFRCGVETATKYKPAKYAVGLGLGYKIGSSEIIIDYSYLLSTVLGGQHLVSLNINFGKKEKIFFEEKQEISGTKKRKTELPSKPININTATAQELAQLPGIGPSTAQKIVEYRQQIGKFKSIEQLLDVPRVGTLTLQRITPYITLGEEEKPSPVSLPAVVQPEKIIEEKQKFNLNTITEEELVNLGFSSTAAKNVIRYRIKVGKFISVDELYKIPYVDHSVVDKIKEKLYVE